MEDKEKVIIFIISIISMIINIGVIISFYQVSEGIDFIGDLSEYPLKIIGVIVVWSGFVFLANSAVLLIKRQKR